MMKRPVCLLASGAAAVVFGLTPRPISQTQRKSDTPKDPLCQSIVAEKVLGKRTELVSIKANPSRFGSIK
jgi:hypothetical protein